MMLSFEEFFARKKIDLQALQMARPALYAEFSDHYAQMGEKSFDHSKKFWFNKLRKEFPWKDAVVAQSPRPEAAAPAPVPAAKAEDDSASSQTVASPDVARPHKGFTPRFKAKLSKDNPPKDQE